MIECKICNRKFTTWNGVGCHVVKTHKVSKEKYYLEYLNKEQGFCKTCGKPTKLLNIAVGFRKFCCVSCSRLNEETQAKFKETNIIRYGDENPYRYGSELYKDNIKSLYLVCNVSQIEEVKLKKEQTFIEHYGCKNTFGIKGVKDKLFSKDMWICRANTLSKNGSSYENYFENKLIELGFVRGIDYKVQYKCKRYPYFCDFYLIESDTFVEIHGHWTHGGHFFDENNPADVEKLNSWKSKNTDFYTKAVETWSIRDVMKLEIAEKNKLDYIVLWNKGDIDIYFENIDKNTH